MRNLDTAASKCQKLSPDKATRFSGFISSSLFFLLQFVNDFITSKQWLRLRWLLLFYPSPESRQKLRGKEGSESLTNESWDKLMFVRRARVCAIYSHTPVKNVNVFLKSQKTKGIY